MAMDRRSFISKILGLTAALGLAPSRITQARRQTSGATSRNFEFAIIGAGLFGSAAARYLSETSSSVALIGPAEPEDHRQHQGLFASHYDASRLVRVVDPDLLWATLAQRSIARFRELEDSSGIPFYKEIGYMMVTPGGLGRDWFNLPAMREVAAELSIEIDDLDDAVLQERFPYLQFTPGSNAVYQGRNAGYIDPRMLLAAQQKISIEQGTSLLRDVVTQINRSGDQIVIDTRSGATLRANRVLVATGAYINVHGLIPKKVDVKVRAAMLMETEVAPHTRGDYPATLYAKTDGEEDFDGHTYIKTMDGYYGPAVLNRNEELNAWNRGSGHGDHRRILERALREVYPSLDVRATQFKPCLITDTASRYPYIDMIDERIGIVAGGNGKAAKSSDEIGRLAAEMMHTRVWPSSLPRGKFVARFL
jgi:sarcosine oxidase